VHVGRIDTTGFSDEPDSGRTTAVTFARAARV
jgi:hypothetical protein